MAHKRSSKKRLVTAISAAVAATGIAAVTAVTAGASPAAEGKIYGAEAKGAVNGSYIVMLKKSVRTAESGDLASKYGGKVKRSYSSAIDGFSATGLSAEEARQLAADPSVDKVVQNKKFHINEAQDNPPSWGLDRIDQADTKGDKKYTYPDSRG